MQAANNMMLILPESASLSREPGLFSEAKAAEPLSEPSTWAAVVEDMAVIEEGVPSQAPGSETGRLVLPALLQTTDSHLMTARPKEEGPQQPPPGEPGELLSVNHTIASAKKLPIGPPTRLDDPILPEAAQDHGGPENREAGVYPVQGAGDIVILEKAAASAATSAGPSQESNNGTPRVVLPAPVDTSMVNAGAEKDGTVAQARAEGQTEALSLQPRPSEKTLQPAPETRGYQAAQGPDTPLPSRDAPTPSNPVIPEKHPHQPISLPQMEPQAAKQHSADVAGSIAALPRKHHLAEKDQAAYSRSPKAPSVEGLPEKSPAAPESRLPGWLALNRPQPAALAGSPENGRQALNAGHSNQQQVVPAMPPAGQVASQPSMAAASASATISPTLDDGATLRLELPLWSAVGTTEMSVNENQNIRPSPDLPRASREMRMLSDVIEKAYWHQENGRAQARIQIKPAFLGHLHLNVLTDQARVSVEIRVETPMAREFIEMNLQSLKTDLQESGLEIDRIDVTVDRDADDSREPFREPARKQNRRPGTPPEMVETAPPDNEAPQSESDNGETSINYFA